MDLKKVWRNLSKKIADNSAKALMSGIRNSDLLIIKVFMSHSKFKIDK